MYRQFLVRPEDRRYQRIIWRNKNGKYQDYELNTVTFGLKPAPFLAIQALHQLADDDGHAYPLAAQALKNDFYVDDALTGATTINGAIELRNQLTNLLQKGGLRIRQWASNAPEVLQGLDQDSINRHLQLGDTSTLKTLGVWWDSTKDMITFSVNATFTSNRLTKRSILSEISKIFDPLGLVAPVIIVAKIFIQRMWNLQLHWDESLPQDLYTEWCKYYEQLKLLNEFNLDRNVLGKRTTELQLHGFCDASERAYGACIYIRAINKEGKPTSLLLCAKSRVAPLKQLTIPRLELCGATLLSTLITTVKGVIQIPEQKIYLWTDSTIVLSWLRTPTNQLKTFVSNRVANIQAQTDINNWHHVHTKDNPADAISRGQLPKVFLANPLWKHGPEWLSSSTELPFSKVHPVKELPNVRVKQCLVACKPSVEDVCTRYSSITKLQRIIAYCLRLKKGTSRLPFITLQELKYSQKIIV